MHRRSPTLMLCLAFAACSGLIGEASDDGSVSGGGATTGGGSASGGGATTGGGSASGGGTTTGGGSASGGGATTGGGSALGGGTTTGGGSASGGGATTGGGSASGGGTTTGGGSASGGGGHVAGGCAGTTYAVCEDFESATVGSAPNGWTVNSGWGSAGTVAPTVQQDQAHWGSQALKSSSDVPGQARLQKALSGAMAQAHWGRLFYKVKTPVPLKSGGGYLHLTFAAVQGADEGRVVDTVEDPSGKHQFLFNVPDDSCCVASSYDWTFDDGWHCAEWYVHASEQSYRFFIDGSEVTTIAFSHNSGSKLSTLSALNVGSKFYVSPTTAFTSWIDDLALDSQRIGCEK